MDETESFDTPAPPGAVIGEVRIHASVWVERGTAETCACGGELFQSLTYGWECARCGKEYG